MAEPDEKEHVLVSVLTIAGSDSGSGAGIQADLKTFAALGVYGLTAITSITAQNTLSVRAAYDIPVHIIEEQIDVVMEDFAVQVAKTGMLSSPEIIHAVSGRVQKWQLRLVVDPVMIAKSGAPLLQEDAVGTMRRVLLPVTEVVTPNIPEAEVLIGREIHSLEGMKDAARAIRDMGPRYVVVKGGHRADDPIDIFFDGETFREFYAARIHTKHTHGTGCSFSSAIVAFIARGWSVEEAVARAKRYITGAIRNAPGIGHGQGPVDHFWLWESDQREQEV